MDKLQGTQQLTIFKIEKHENNEETLLFCGFAENQEEIVKYMENVQKEVDYSMQYQLAGEYVVLPSIYFNIKRR